jgi:hypothetical protein
VNGYKAEGSVWFKKRLHYEYYESWDTEISSPVPRGPWTKNDCAGEDHQKIKQNRKLPRAYKSEICDSNNGYYLRMQKIRGFEKRRMEQGGE